LPKLLRIVGFFVSEFPLEKIEKKMNDLDKHTKKKKKRPTFVVVVCFFFFFSFKKHFAFV